MNLSEESIIDESITGRKQNATDSNSNFEDLILLESKIPRKFSAGEIDKLTYVFGITADQQINCVLNFDGFFDIERLIRAVTLIFYAEQFLVVVLLKCQKKHFGDVGKIFTNWNFVLLNPLQI
ncbi:MAG TPA: hypothetical protein VMX55_03260 [candidate division Zixibacteria bacterium]|nr:hypothetical protein [candidate division Zixibacteria bacterium]